MAGREEGALRDDRVREAEEEVVGMSEREVGDAAEAIVEKLKTGREDWIETCCGGANKGERERGT